MVKWLCMFIFEDRKLSFILLQYTACCTCDKMAVHFLGWTITFPREGTETNWATSFIGMFSFMNDHLSPRGDGNYSLLWPSSYSPLWTITFPREGTETGPRHWFGWGSSHERSPFPERGRKHIWKIWFFSEFEPNERLPFPERGRKLYYSSTCIASVIWTITFPREGTEPLKMFVIIRIYHLVLSNS